MLRSENTSDVNQKHKIQISNLVRRFIQQLYRKCLFWPVIRVATIRLDTDDRSTMAKAAKTGRKASTRRDGRVPTLIYVLPEVLDAAQKVAEARGMKSWEWIEIAMKRELRSRSSKSAADKQPKD